MKWQTRKLGEVCDISIGKTPARGNKKFWDTEKISNNVWLSIRDLNNTSGKKFAIVESIFPTKEQPYLRRLKKGHCL
jgi:type I restriction enzyme S subunit